MFHEIILLGVGVFVGVMNAIAGGGSLIGFPVLLASGLSPIVANATTHLTVLPGALSAAFAYRKQLHQVRKAFILLMIPCLLGSAIGALALRMTPSSNFERIVPELVLFAVILFAFQPLLHFHLHSHLKKSKNKYQAFKPLIVFSLAILPMAIYGGYFGAGFGFLMLAFLGFTSLKDAHQMNAIKNLASACISVASIALLFNSHLINWEFGLTMATGNLIGGYCGAAIAQKVSSHVLRIVVITAGLTTATYLGLRVY